MNAKHIHEKVQERYSTVATNSGGEYGQKVAQAFGYTMDELGQIPQDANLGLSCGNPLTVAKLKKVRCLLASVLVLRNKGRQGTDRRVQDEVVVDLGSGAGIDVFLASKKVGPSGKVIGVDMNKVRVCC